MEPHLSTSDRRPLSVVTMDSISITPNPVGAINAVLIPASGAHVYANPPTPSYGISPTPPTYYLVQQPHMIHPEHVVKVGDSFEGRFRGEEEPEREREGKEKRFRIPSISPTSSCTSLIPTKTPLPVFGADDIDVGIGICGWLLTAVSWFIVIITLPFSLCVCFKVVQEYERAVIFRLGRLLDGGSKGPGIFFVLPCIESYQKVDLRTITLDVPPQEVLTRDSVTVSVDAVVYYRVSNATVSVANVENAHHSTRLLAQTTLRNILGTKNLHEILSDRESISASMQSALDEATEPWGIKVERVEIKDVRLPVQLQRAMAAEAEAAREARAKVIAAEGEQKASRALRDAADVITTSPSAIQLRYLQTLNSISAEKNSTIIFPIPLDLISNLMKRN
ncbi:band 7 protein AGAP004871-like isoform X1 [Tigriopus californicus]|uniref:band 7 protein AGAP004871-like isoform X1 n=1 Tax=Tigriopus californicus TaxID=6832 RepID=UPI0027D9FC4F|nr:band 7 protein AGAP004871-like isoform X1 [Tigriopus californicus]